MLNLEYLSYQIELEWTIFLLKVYKYLSNQGPNIETTPSLCLNAFLNQDFVSKECILSQINLDKL